VGAVVQHDLPVDDDVVHAFGALYAPGGAGRSVVGDLVLPDPDARQIEDHEIGGHALPQEASVMETHDAGGLEGQPADGVFEGQELTLAHPLTEDVTRLAGGAEIRVEVGAGVGLGGQGMAGLHEIGQRDIIRGRPRLQLKLCLQSLVDRQIEHHVRHVLALSLGEVGESVPLEGPVLGEDGLADHDRLPRHEAAEHARPAPLALHRRLAKLRTLVGIGEDGQPLLQRKVHDAVPDLEIAEEGRLPEREPRIEGNRPHEGVELRALPRRDVHVAARLGVEDQEEDGSPARQGDLAQVVA